MTQVWDGFPGSGPELLTMLALADWSDDAGKCYPSISSIAEKTRLSRSQAQRNVHKLIEGGFLVVTANALGGSPAQTRHYRIALSRLTGSTHATGSVDATGRIHAAEGSHGCANRGSTHATQTVIEPSITVKKVSRIKKTGITLNQFLEDCKANSEKTFPENDPVFEYADTVGIDHEMVAVCWQEFKAAYLPGKKTYADWRAAFRNAVRKNYYKLWFVREGEQAAWTSVGEQARRVAA
jgi:hypothetical protein